MSVLIAATLAAGLLAAGGGHLSVDSPETILDGSATSNAHTLTGENPNTSSKWGVNDKGWNLTIVNDTPARLLTAYTALSNVATADPEIPRWTTNRSVRGVESIFGGPANMDIMLNLADGSNVAWVLIRSDAISNVPAVSCRVSSPEHTCSVSAPSIAVPVQLTITKTVQ